MSYLDNLYILSKDPSYPILKRLEGLFKESSFSLNIAKSKEYTISDLKREGITALGTYIGPLKGKRTFLSRKITLLRSILTLLEQVPK